MHKNGFAYFTIKTDLGIEEGKSDILLKYMSMNTDELVCEFKTVENQLIQQGLQELDELNAYFNALGIEKIMSFDPELARGLEI